MTSRIETLQRALSNLTYQTVIALLLVIGFTLVCYWPGLSGSFHLDDFLNLKPLANYTDKDWQFRAMNFIFGGRAGPGGRPLSMASFLINDISWPSDPRPFIYTNLMFHLLNGILVFYLSFRLLPYVPATIAEKKQLHVVAATVIALLWTLHPLQITTALYVVQRMTELSATFVLLALIGHLALRKSVDTSKFGFLWISMNVSILGILAYLAKENGFLLVLYILIFEKIILQKQNPIQHRLWNRWQQVFLIAPILLSVAYFAAKSDQFQDAYRIREFTPWTRMITESRILLEYLYNIIIPNVGGNGLYHDDYVLSQGLFDPPATFFAMIAIGLLIYLGFKLKNRLPLLSFALLWFFASHVLESTYLPLELYFEHRNYLAIFGFSFFVVVSVFSLASSSKIKIPAQFALFAVVFVLAGITRLDAQVWGKPNVAEFIWLDEHPRSIRATQDAVRIAATFGEHDKARQLLKRTLQYYPKDAALNMLDMLLACENSEYDPAMIPPLLNVLKSAKYSVNAIMMVLYMVENIPIKECPELTNADAIKITLTLINNKKIRDDTTRYWLYRWLGEFYIKERNLNATMESLDKSDEYMQTPEVPLLQASVLISAGLYADAEKYVQRAIQYDEHPNNLLFKNLYKKNIENVSKILDMNKNAVSKN